MHRRGDTSLLLLDYVGRGWSRFHADRTEAWNVLFGIGAAAAEAVHAIWLFFHPSVAVKAGQLWKDVGGGEEGFGTAPDDHDKVR